MDTQVTYNNSTPIPIHHLAQNMFLHFFRKAVCLYLLVFALMISGMNSLLS